MNHDNRSATNDSYYGRKRAILFLCVPLLAGWVTVLLSGGGFALLCAGRVLQGAGIMSSVTQVYLVEIADVKRRWADENWAENGGRSAKICMGAKSQNMDPIPERAEGKTPNSFIGSGIRPSARKPSDREINS